MTLITSQFPTRRLLGLALGRLICVSDINGPLLLLMFIELRSCAFVMPLRTSTDDSLIMLQQFVISSFSSPQLQVVQFYKVSR